LSNFERFHFRGNLHVLIKKPWFFKNLWWNEEELSAGYPNSNNPETMGSRSNSSGYGSGIMNWDTLSDRDSKTLDNFELGKVKQVADDYIYTEKGVLQKDKFYIPRRFADRFDGKTLWFAITKGQAENEFKREAPPALGEYAKRYTTVEKRITEKTIETGPSGERREKVEEKSG
jgi:hypothetical protein